MPRGTGSRPSPSPRWPDEDVGPLIERHRDAGIELRFVTDVWPLWDEVVGSGRYQFSGCRLDNTGVQRDWRT